MAMVLAGAVIVLGLGVTLFFSAMALTTWWASLIALVLFAGLILSAIAVYGRTLRVDDDVVSVRGLAFHAEVPREETSVDIDEIETAQGVASYRIALRHPRGDIPFARTRSLTQASREQLRLRALLADA